jgi:hypothetical protein
MTKVYNPLLGEKLPNLVTLQQGHQVGGDKLIYLFLLMTSLQNSFFRHISELKQCFYRFIKRLIIT